MSGDCGSDGFSCLLVVLSGGGAVEGFGLLERLRFVSKNRLAESAEQELTIIGLNPARRRRTPARADRWCEILQPLKPANRERPTKTEHSAPIQQLSGTGPDRLSLSAPRNNNNADSFC
ncbi:hypothetical protein AOLI_G00330460 [Acnodon oligacanthus]